eukprot:CAMPEP_0183338434 /NCGR_PEP_ID=MMETSP0164_2-20130417/5732_1 /TAXON_ID=221442 /ORGANISM="Coccolithus pelagicus ssp braarudi, Strain PLY182g" /LENGTH=42 /DNA_ID= /DNA_START= /DNA_END= /DNA_ORIENTATION=
MSRASAAHPPPPVSAEAELRGRPPVAHAVSAANRARPGGGCA